MSPVTGLPARGPSVRSLGLPLPPARMPRSQSHRPLKHWRYVGAFGPDLQLCAGVARIGPVPVRWWAIAQPGRPLIEGRRGLRLEPGSLRLQSRDVEIELRLEEREPVETATGYGDTFAWTAKQADIPARGHALIGGQRHEIDTRAVIDDSAGYHPRHTEWRWSAGVGRLEDGRSVGWNLVEGIHDSPEQSERSLWIDGAASELGPVGFDGLAGIAFASGERLGFEAWAERKSRTNALLMRSYYRQPFGSFSGSLPGAGRLAAGYGVMEEHDVYW